MIVFVCVGVSVVGATGAIIFNGVVEGTVLIGVFVVVVVGVVGVSVFRVVGVEIVERLAAWMATEIPMVAAMPASAKSLIKVR